MSGDGGKEKVRWFTEGSREDSEKPGGEGGGGGGAEGAGGWEIGGEEEGELMGGWDWGTGCLCEAEK